MDDNLRLLLELTKNQPPPDDFNPTNYDAKELLEAYRKRYGVEPGPAFADNKAVPNLQPKMGE